MKTLKFAGASDDTFGDEETGTDHDNCANGKPMVFRVLSSSVAEGLFVWGQYSGRDWPASAPGCWVVGVQQLEEDVPLPGWPIRFETAPNGYSPLLLIDAPDDVTVEYWNGASGDDD